MKRTVTTREYDEQGQVTKEVVSEEITPELAPMPAYPYWNVCTCGMGVLCSFHPLKSTVTFTTSTTSDKELAKAVARRLGTEVRHAPR